MPGQSSLTNITSVIGTISKAQKTALFHKIGGIASKLLGPIQIMYGLALAAIEVHCTGYCCAAWRYGLPYTHADGYIVDAWKDYYFGEWL